MLLYHLAVKVYAAGASELRGVLQTDGEGERLPVGHAEVEALVVHQSAGGDEVGIVVELLFEPAGIGEFAVSHVGHHLQPSAGKRHVLETDEAEAHLRHGARVVAVYEVSASERREDGECVFPQSGL